MPLKGVFLLDKEMEYQSLIKLMTSKTLIKKVTPFLLSVSVFSFIFSNSSWYSLLFRFFKFYFSSFPMQVLSHAMDKSWIFLICNGILVVIANTSGSGMVHSPSGSDLNDLLPKKISDDLQAPPVTKDTSLEVMGPENVVPEIEVVEEEEENYANQEEEEGGGGGGGEREGTDDECLAENQEESSCLILDDEEEQEKESESVVTEEGDGGEETKELQTSSVMGDEENEEESETCFMIEEEDDQDQSYNEEKEWMDKLSTEELNKKFDDFIRKMKEELRIEAQQQHLILVK